MMGFSAAAADSDEAKGSRMEGEAAATKIQASFRGYSVRRRKPLIHLYKIGDVRRKLNELQAKASDPAYIERICVDVMECRKLTEGIMALLLQLDALQGVHPVVRDIRKSVNREVVQFMEVIDAVVVGAESSPWQDSRNAPNIVRSNSISHFDRSVSYPLRRIMSLDNHICPETPYELQSEATSKDEPREVDHANVGDTTIPARSADYSSCGIPTCSTCGADSMSVEPLPGNFGLEKETGRLEADLVGIERIAAAALIVQSRFRGYRVRRSRPLKHLRNISYVKSKLRELSIQVSSPDFPLKLRFDNMERLRLTESITALLLQLDSVQGVDQVVRDIRKSVTREVFKLQELVDTMINEAKNGMGSTFSMVGSNEIIQEQRSLENIRGEIPAATLVSHGKNESFKGYDEVDSLDCGLDAVAVRDVSTSEGVVVHPLVLQPRQMSSHHVGGADNVVVGTLDSDKRQKNVALNHFVIGSSTECDSAATELDNVQVRVLDMPLQNSATSCSSAGSAGDNQLNDQQSGLCAAVLSAVNYSCHTYDEHVGALTTLKSNSSTMEEVSVGAVHQDDVITSKLGSKQQQDKCADVVDKVTHACALSNANMEDMQASALPGARWWTPSKNTSTSFVRHMYDIQHMGTFGLCKSSSIIQQKAETLDASETLEVNSLELGREQSEGLSDNYTPAGIAEPDLMVQKYNFNPSPGTPTGIKFSDERGPTSNIPIWNEGELLLPSETCSEVSGMQYFDRSRHQTTKTAGEKFYHEDKLPAPSTVELENHKKSSSLLQPSFEYSAPAENVKDYVSEVVKAFPLLTKEGEVSHNLAKNLHAKNRQHSGFIVTVDAPNAAAAKNNEQRDIETMELNNEHRDIETMEFISQLVDENTKLRTLLNEVLIFAEMQSTTVKGKLERLESENIRHNRRDDISRKKSKNARRRR